MRAPMQDGSGAVSQLLSRTARWARVMAAVLTMQAATAHAEPDDGPFRFGPHVQTLGSLAAPTAVLFDAEGRLLIAEADAGQVRRIDAASGRTQAIFSGPLARPNGIALDAQGRIYVSDAERDRIEVFSPDGPHLFGFGGRGSEPGELMEPRGLAVSDDVIAVADGGNARVQIFGIDGAFHRVLDLGAAVIIESPAAVAFDGAQLIVTDRDAHRVLRWDFDERSLETFGERGPFRGLLDQPAAVAVDGDHLLVLETSNHRVQTFEWLPDADARSAEVFGVHAILPREGEGKLHYPSGFATGRLDDGTRIAAIAEPLEDRVQLFRGRRADEPPVTDPWDPEMIPRQTHFGTRFALDGPLLLIPETEAHVLRLFDLSGTVPIMIGEFGERGRTSGLYDRPAAVHLDFEAREIVVGDEVARRFDRLQVSFDPEAARGFSPRRIRLAESFEAAIAGADAAGRFAPAAIDRFSDGTMIVLDARRREIMLVAPDRTTLPWIRSAGGPFIRPVDVVVTDDQHILVVDAGARAVIVFDRSGNEVARLEDETYLRRPGGAARARDGRTYVSDSRRSCIVVFGPDGAYERSFGGPGAEPGELWQPAGVAIDDEGRIFVMDYGNHRMQIFHESGAWLVAFGTGRAFVRREAVE